MLLEARPPSEVQAHGPWRKRDSHGTDRMKTHPRQIMLMCGAVVAMTLLVAPVASAERKNDEDVKQMIERIDEERDRFEDQLDGTLKRSIVRGPRGEVNVERYLDDLQENVDDLKERFKPDYTASTEVTTILRQGSDIQRFMGAQKPNFDGASEWNRLAASLGELATAYGTAFPMGEGQTARRLNDAEDQRRPTTWRKAWTTSSTNWTGR